MTLRNQREREFFYLSSRLVSIEIFTSNLGNLCSLFYTDHFLTIVEILFTKQVFFYLFTKDFACLFSRRLCNQNGIGDAFNWRKLKTNYEWCQWFNSERTCFEQIRRVN